MLFFKLLSELLYSLCPRGPCSRRAAGIDDACTGTDFFKLFAPPSSFRQKGRPRAQHASPARRRSLNGAPFAWPPKLRPVLFISYPIPCRKASLLRRLFGPKRRQGAVCTASLPSIAPQATAAPQRPSSASANPTKTGVPPAAPVQSCHTSCGRPQQAQK